MQFIEETAPNQAEITKLFQTAFTTADSAEEGAMVADLVAQLLAAPVSAGVRRFAAHDGATLAGCILFSPLHYAKDSRRVALLSPVAVAADRQRRGVGSRLIRHGLRQLQQDGISIVATYGDPAYYGRLGFCQIDAAQLPPPHPLSQPIGWQALALTGAPVDAAEFAPLCGPCSCLAAFDSPELW